MRISGQAVSSQRGSPILALGGGVLLILIGLATAFSVTQSRTAAARSGYTQANGVPDHATVNEVANHRCDNNPNACSPSADVWVTLDKPVAGSTSTIVSVPDIVPYTAGQSIVVLVDPKDPGYAELRGRPAETRGGSGAPIGEAAAVGMLIAGCGGIIHRVWTRWRKGVWMRMWPFR